MVTFNYVNKMYYDFKAKKLTLYIRSFYGNANVFIKIRWTFPSKVGQRILNKQ